MYIYKKISTKIYFLNRCSKYLSQKARETIYNTIILPHFYIAGSVLYLCNQSNINKLQLIQNRAMRTILQCNKYIKLILMLNELRWYTVKYLLQLQPKDKIQSVS